VAKGEKGELLSTTPLGRVTIRDERHGGAYSSDQIGGCVPAVPCEDALTFWGYTSVPSEGVAWWKRLPLRPGDPENAVCPRCADAGRVLVKWRLTPCPLACAASTRAS
jgi:hypothetical protein